jgi:tetratricopeptide (TPR) repeat protein
MTNNRIHRLLSVILAGTAFASIALAHDTADSQRGKELFQPGLKYAAGVNNQVRDSKPPLYEGLGSMRMPVTTASKEAQAYFNQGWTLTWGFNHAEALRSFREAQKLDPDFAMAYWGEAFARGPNINDIMHDDAVKPAYEAIQRAKALSGKATEKEKALIDALATRYSAQSAADRSALDQEWVANMKKAATQHSNDANVLVLYADALMNLQPWDYWESDGVTPKRNAAEIVATLEKALAVDPDHPAAAHLYIHAVEASATPERAEAVADRLRGSTPGVGHLVHMPSHLYLRLGRHKESMEVNRAAIAADAAFVAVAGDNVSTLYRFGYYPHNVHFLLASAQMSGLKEDMFRAAEQLEAITSDEVSQQVAWVQAIKTASFSAHAQFSDTPTILSLKQPSEQFPFVKGFWHYARGVAFAKVQDAANARNEVKAIEQLIASADMSSLEAQFLPAKTILTLAKNIVEARIAQSGNDLATAEKHLREAVELESSIPYMEPPYWYYPVRQTLAAVLLQQGRASEATEMFKAALKERPRNAWALWGLMQAQRKTGDTEISKTESAFKKAWLGEANFLTLERL